MRTVGETARALRDRPLGRIFVLGGVVLAAVVVSRSCQRNYVRLTPDAAVAIAQKEIDFRPEGHSVRIVQRGIPPKRYWAVSFWIRDSQAKGGYSKLTVVLVDANRGTVTNVYVNRP